MAGETIQVVYEPLGTLPGTGATYCHETLLRHARESMHERRWTHIPDLLVRTASCVRK